MQYTTQDGLPKMYTECISQDSKGFIWIGTSHGAVRFNGFRFESFEQTDDVGIVCFRESKEKNLMAFAFDAYYVFDSKTERFTSKEYPEKLYFSEMNSRSLPAGYAIFGQVDGDAVDYLLCRIADEEIEPVSTIGLLDGMENSQSPYYDEKQGVLYLPCGLHSLVKAVTLTGETLFSQSINRPYAIFKHREDLYCVAESGIYRWNGKEFEIVVQHYFPTSYSFIKTAIDANGDLIISDLKEVFRFRDNRLESIFNGANLLMDICVDREGNLWLATYQGVFNLFRQQFKNYLLSDKKDMFRIIAGNPAGEGVITGTFDGKLLAVDPERNREISYPPNEHGYFFENYCASLPEAVYLPGANGILKYSANSISWLNIPPQEYRCIASTPDGNLIAGWESSYYFLSSSGKVLRHLKSKDIKQFGQSRPCFDREHNLYIGGDKGVTKVTEDESTLISDPDFPNCIVLRSDNNGTIWGASHQKLFRIKDDKIVLFKELDGIITTLFFTRDNQLIAGSTKGIFVFDSTLKHVVLYDRLNGYTLAEPVRCDMFEDEQGNIWMPSIGGIACFNPKSLLVAQPRPILHVLYPESSSDNIHWNRVEQSKAQLSHSQTNLRFHYIGLSYSQAQNVRYYYRLHGFQKEWSEPTQQREVTFNNLPPGEYTFEVYADAGTMDSRSEIQSISFSIEPAFWQTTWFIVAGVAFLMLAGAGIALLVQRRRNRVVFEKLRTEKELNELRISSIRLKAIPHFNANVLSAIEYYIVNRTKEESMRLLGIYSDFTLKTLSEVDKASRPLSEELAYVKMYLDLEKIRFRDKFDFRIEVEKGVDKNVELPNMILHTYCENAIKHGLMPLKSGGVLTISVTQDEQKIRISVEDNGVGRAYASRNPHLHSTKQGLSILTRQIEIYNRFNSDKIVQQVEDLLCQGRPAGTRFTVEVPLNFEYIN